MTFDEWLDSIGGSNWSFAMKEIAKAGWQAALESRVLAERKPVAWADRHDLERLSDGTLTIAGAGAKQNRDNVPLFAHPTPDDASDAARYRFLKAKAERLDYDAGWRSCWRIESVDIPSEKPRATLDEAIDAAIDRARQSGEEGK